MEEVRNYYKCFLRDVKRKRSIVGGPNLKYEGGTKIDFNKMKLCTRYIWL
jgi:hypothetical protein